MQEAGKHLSFASATVIPIYTKEAMMPNGTVKKGEPRRPILKIKTPDGNGGNLSSVAHEAGTPTEDSIRAIRARLEDVFNALGTEGLPGTVIPSGQRNNSKEAAEFVAAELLAKLAAKRLKLASQLAEKAGVFGTSDDYIEGSSVMVFSDPNFSISVKMGTPSEMLGREEVELAAEKYLGKKASEFLDECKKPRAATKQIIVSMK